MNQIDAMLEQLRTGGWTKHEYFGAGGSCCILGAHKIVNAAANGSLFTDTIGAVLAEQYPDRLLGPVPEGLREEGMWVYIPEFNDHPDTVFEDVERVLEKASLRLEEGVS